MGGWGIDWPSRCVGGKDSGPKRGKGWAFKDVFNGEGGIQAA